MASEVLGEAVVEIRAAFGKFDADMKRKMSNLAPVQVADRKHLEALKAGTSELEKQDAHVRSILGLQVKANQQAAAQSGRNIPAGATGSKSAMMIAQGTYALQDLLTGASMGNVNMALLGMSNNLSMIAMLWGGLGGTITSVAASALPLIYTGLKALVSEENHAKDAVEQLNRALERQRFGFKLNAIAREALTDAEVKRMHGAANLQGRVEAEGRALKDVNEEIDERNKKLRGDQQLENKARGFAIAGHVPANDPLMQQLEKLRQDAIKMGAVPGPGFSPAGKGQIQAKLGLKGGINDYEFLRDEKGAVEVRRKVIGEEKANAEKQLGEINKDISTLEEQQKKYSENLKKLGLRRDQQVKEELEFRQLDDKARFNTYQQRKIRLNRDEREEKRRNEEAGFGDVITKPAMSEANLEQRFAQIDKDEQDALLQNRKDMDALHNKKLIHGRHLSKQELSEFTQKQEDIKAGAEAERKAALEEFRKGPTTLLEDANKLTASEFKRRRIDLAEEFANKGPRGHFTGIEQLAKQVQMGMEGGKAIDFAQKTADNTKGTQQAIIDLTKAVKDLNLGVGP